MRAIMRGARHVLPARAVADFSYRVPRASGNGWLAVGDAGGVIDPLFSTRFPLAVKVADPRGPAGVGMRAGGGGSPASLGPGRSAPTTGAPTRTQPVLRCYA